MATEAEILAKLNLGTSKQVLEENPNSPLGELLTQLTNDVIIQLTKSLDKYNISASHNLRQSIVPTKVMVDDGNVAVAINADFYWKYVNYGVNGTEVNYGSPAWGHEKNNTKSFNTSIQEWVRNRGIVAPEQFGDYEQFAYAIMSNIKRKGQKPRPFYTDVVNDKLKEHIRKPIERLMKKSITITIIDPWQ